MLPLHKVARPQRKDVSLHLGGLYVMGMYLKYQVQSWLVSKQGELVIRPLTGCHVGRARESGGNSALLSFDTLLHHKPLDPCMNQP